MKTLKLSIFCLLAISAIACQKKSTPLTVEPSAVVLYSEGKEQLTANPAEGVTYTSKDDFYAEVDANGLVTANKVGATEIVASSSNGTVRIPVGVLPAYVLYPELTQLVNSSLSAMTNLLGTNYERSTSEKGEPIYLYRDYNVYTAGIIASFSNGTCTGLCSIISTSYLTQFTKYLLERYTVAGKQNDYYFFLNHDKTVVIGMTLYNIKYMMAIYAPYTGTKSDQIDMDSIVERFRSLGLE